MAKGNAYYLPPINHVQTRLATTSDTLYDQVQKSDGRLANSCGGLS